MRATSRAFIIRDNNILLIHRVKRGKHYYVIPGGGIESGESEEDTVKREIQEELSLEILKLDKNIGTFINDDSPVTYFLVTQFKGNIAVGGEEKERMDNDPTNIYIPEWVNIDTLKRVKLYPKFAKRLIFETARSIQSYG